MTEPHTFGPDAISRKVRWRLTWISYFGTATFDREWIVVRERRRSHWLPREEVVAIRRRGIMWIRFVAPGTRLDGVSLSKLGLGLRTDLRRLGWPVEDRA